MKGLGVFSVLLLASFLATVRSQTQTIEFLSANTDPPGQGVRYDEELATVPAIAKRCNKICFNGMWAMYNTTSYGNANPKATTVYPALGYTLQSCSTSVGPIASKINSFKPLAVATNVMPVAGTGIEFWDLAYFLGLSVPAIPAAAVLPNVLSFAINNFQMTNKAYVICNKAEICACCDTLNGHYLVPDIRAWPKGNPLGDIATFTGVPTSADFTCKEAMYQPLN